MSLARLALRISAVEALRGRTLVADNVLDSELGALDFSADGTVRTARTKPFISVYTDDGDAEIDGNEPRGLHAGGMCQLVFEIGVAAAMVAGIDPETGESHLAAGIPVTDQALEYYLDMTARQIADALTDPGNPWGKICRGVMLSMRKMERRRAGNGEDGLKLAAHQLRIHCAIMDDPVRGEVQDPASPFMAFLDALDVAAAGDSPVAAYAIYAAAIRAEIAGADEDWENLQRRLGATAGEILTLGRGPLAGDEDRATPPLAAGTTEIAGMAPVETNS